MKSEKIMKKTSFKHLGVYWALPKSWLTTQGGPIFGFLGNIQQKISKSKNSNHEDAGV